MNFAHPAFDISKSNCVGIYCNTQTDRPLELYIRLYNAV